MASSEAASPFTYDSCITSMPLSTDSMVTVPLSLSDETVPVHHLDAAVVTASNDTVDNKCSGTTTPALHDAKAEDTGNGSLETDSEPTDCLPSLVARRPRSGSARSGDSSGKVNWDNPDELDGNSYESMARLLARLDQENEAIATDPKSATSKGRARAPIQQSKSQYSSDESACLSMMPSPPPMTEHEFWGSIVRDYPGTLRCLPTVVPDKIRKGIPSPLRGLVWRSMAGANDRAIEDTYDELRGKSSPWADMISKDIGRSFPLVQQFKDPDGQGQKALARVLESFSAYDEKIGYCQGLGFIVGLLLMHMEEKMAFCVLVRLIEKNVDLRSCFLVDLSGLELRIHQFRRLMQFHLPVLYAHLEPMDIPCAYLPQWFLTLFAANCPLHMLVRIYDVIFAEGTSVTVMRVALAVMRKNQQKLLEKTEPEEVVELLRSRSLWEAYGCSEESVNHFVEDVYSLTGVTCEHLQDLLSTSSSDDLVSPSFLNNLQTSVQSLLGRMRGPDKKNAGLTPSLPADKPSSTVGVMTRTTSKHSIASTLNSIETASDSTSVCASTATAMTEPTNRDSTTDAMSMKSTRIGTAISPSTFQNERDLNYQIEELLVAMTNTNRELAAANSQLEKERKNRSEDQYVMRSLVEHVKQDNSIKLLDTTKGQHRCTASLGAKGDVRDLVNRAEKLLSPEPQLDRHVSTLDTKQRRDLDEAQMKVSSQETELEQMRQRLHDLYYECNGLRQVIARLNGGNEKLNKVTSWSGADVASARPGLARADTVCSTPSATRSIRGLREFKFGRYDGSRVAPTSTPLPASYCSSCLSMREELEGVCDMLNYGISSASDPMNSPAPQEPMINGRHMSGGLWSATRSSFWSWSTRSASSTPELN